jgi:hypothetical protein
MIPRLGEGCEYKNKRGNMNPRIGVGICVLKSAMGLES